VAQNFTHATGAQQLPVEIYQAKNDKVSTVFRLQSARHSNITVTSFFAAIFAFSKHKDANFNFRKIMY